MDDMYWSDLFDKYHVKLYWYIFTMSLNSDIAADVVSETYITVINRSSIFIKYEHDYAALEKISRNIYLKRYHKTKREKMSFEEFYTSYYQETISDIETIVTISEEDEKLTAVLKNLSPEDYRIVSLYYFYGHNFKQIAEEINVKYTTVLYRHKRALEHLRFDLTGEYGPLAPSIGNRPKNMFFIYLAYLCYLIKG